MNRAARVRDRIRARHNRRPYQTVAIGLYEDQTRAIDQAIQEMQQAGYTKANRSLIFQTLAKRFLQEIEGLDQEQILEYLLRSHLKRPLAPAISRRRSSPSGEEVSDSPPKTQRNMGKRRPALESRRG